MRQWIRLAIQASAWVEGTDKGDRELKFRDAAAVHWLCDKAFAKGPDGPEVAAWALTEVGLFGFPDRVFSGLLTRLVRSPFDRGTRQGFPIREPLASVFGGLLIRLVETDAEKTLAWIVDMAQGNRLAGVERQPTAVLRGLLFAPRADWTGSTDFWELAAACGRFPDRVFCDPCDPADGCIFSSYHYRAFGRFFSAVTVPESAVRRFAAAMRDGITRKAIREVDEESRHSRIRLVPASPEEIREVRHRIIESVTWPLRRRMVSDILYPPPAEPGEEPEEGIVAPAQPEAEPSPE